VISDQIFLEPQQILTQQKFSVVSARPQVFPLIVCDTNQCGIARQAKEARIFVHRLSKHLEDKPCLTVAMNPGCDMHYHTDPQNGYLLFQQAIIQGGAEAWEQIYRLYTPLVRKWVVYHPSFANTSEEVDYFVNRAFEKIWRALTPEKFAHFPDLKALLAYLQMCVNSVIVDHVRTEQPYWLDLDSSEDHRLFYTLPTDDHLWHEAQRQQFWGRIRKRLKNETEYKLLYYRFVLGFKPGEICEQFGDTFPDVNQIYTLTQNILARLRRDPELAAYLHDPELIGSLSMVEL
jgi:DNA-directed RNA polymerase specialized sigma24 family protein